jgi:rare lipoprotein A
MKRTIALFVLIPALAVLAGAAETAEGFFRQEGIASWYGAEFEGRPTASGEIFSASQLTAAHPILPFGTMLRITNKNNNKSVMVRVNDRGPFVATRIIDISRAAAQQLDMIDTGTAPVLVESIEVVRLPVKPAPLVSTPVLPVAQPVAQPPLPFIPDPSQQVSPVPGGVVQIYPGSAEPFGNPVLRDTAPQDAVPQFPVQPPRNVPRTAVPARLKPAVPETETGGQYRIQVGAYKTPRNAVDAFQRLREAGLNPSYEKYDDYYRVVLSGVRSEDLKTVSERLGRAGFDEALVRKEP